VRIKELAELTATTVRTVRYYHQIGLLPVPDRRDGHRDYDLLHVARVVRIRWLAQAGIRLATIAVMLGEQTPNPGVAAEVRRESVLADLRAGVTALDKQLLELQSQRDQMQRLIAGVEQDGHLSPMPAAMVWFYDRMLAQATDEKTRRVIRQERDFMELAFYRGEMPAESAVVYEKLTASGLVDSFFLFQQIGDEFQRVIRSLDLDLARRAADLYVRLVGPEQRRLSRAIGDAILTTIEKGQTP
jgi:DNA-binding transcriptional MerR regulator